MTERLEKLSDEELMTLYQDAREDAFRVLYDRHRGRMYGYLRKRLPNAEAANDVFQAAFLKLHRSKDQFDASYSFHPWLFTVVKPSMLDWQRKQRRAPSSVPLDEEAFFLSAAVATAPPDVSSLPEREQKAIELRYTHECSFEEIAARLNTSPGNARQIVSRALRSLKVLFSTSEGAE